MIAGSLLKPGQGFLGRQDAREGQRREDQHGGDVDAESLRDEEDQARRRG